MRTWLLTALASLLVALPAASRATDLVGPRRFLVLRVEAQDQSSPPTYTADDVKSKFFDNVKQLWSQYSSYGTIDLQFQISNLYKLPSNFTDYFDVSDTDSSHLNDQSSLDALQKAADDAIAVAVADPSSGLNWTNLGGIVVFVADTRPGGFTVGETAPLLVHLPSGDTTLPVSLISENPTYHEDRLPRAWGRIAHEIGHALQKDGPAHPSVYRSDYEEMDDEYPAQTGVFEKQSGRGFPGWLPSERYLEVHAPTGTATTLLSAEQSPANTTDAQALRAYLGFGGDMLYYLVSVRRRVLGDDLNINQPAPPPSPTDCDLTATPNGIPDCGVLIERVVEGGDPAIPVCNNDIPPYCLDPWVHVLDNVNPDRLWHDGDVYSSPSDGITIAVHKGGDRDHYSVKVSYDAHLSVPDVGLSDWLRPPSNNDETTDIWVDSPVNGYANPPDTDAAAYRYGVQDDLKGGTVPKGNGDDPAIGQVNRIYARVRNFGTAPATNVTVHFDVTDPPGLGISGANGFKEIGAVTSAQFPALASIRPGGVANVYIEWTPEVALTADQLTAGRFSFNTGLRVRVDHVSGETFFANQDGDGEQENIGYVEATSAPGAPGAPAAPNEVVVHLRNDSATSPKTFLLALLRDDLPRSWQVDVNKGVPLVSLAPGEVRDIRVAVRQSATEPIGSRHRLRLTASSQITLTRAGEEPHVEIHPLGGATIEVGVVRRTVLDCSRSGGGRVDGRLTGFDPNDREVRVHLVEVKIDHNNLVTFTPTSAWAKVDLHTGLFTFPGVTPGLQLVCLYAGSSTSASAASRVFTN